MLVHVAIVSEQILANLIPALMDKPARMYLACSPDMAHKGLDRRLQSLLQAKGIDTIVLPSAPDAGMTRIAHFARSCAARVRAENAEAQIVLNATGGTKLMMLGFVNEFAETAARVIYTDTAHRRLEFLPKHRGESAVSRAMKDVLDVPDYLAAQGFEYAGADSDDAGWRDRAKGRAQTAEYLARNVQTLGDFIGALNALASGALDKRGYRLENPSQHFASAPRGRWKEALRSIADAGLLKWDGQAGIEFVDVESTRFLSGGWLEEYAWHTILEQQAFDARMSVKGAWQAGAAATNEFDLLATHHNQLLFMECKTLRHGREDAAEKDSDILYKLDSLGRDARGLFGSSWLLAARRPTEEMLGRARAQDIRIVGPDEIPNLGAIAKEWIGQ